MLFDGGFLLLFYVDGCFTHIYVCVYVFVYVYMYYVYHIYALYPWSPEEGIRFPRLELELQMVESYHMCAGNWYQVLWKQTVLLA